MPTAACERSQTCKQIPAAVNSIYTHGAEAICDRLPALQRQRRGVALFDEGEVAAVMMARPVMKATHIFDLIQVPGSEHTEQNLGELLKHFTSAYL